MRSQKTFIAIFIGFACLLISWSKQHEPVQGVAVLKTRVWSEKLKKYVIPKHSDDMRIWYRDSLLIYHRRTKICEVTGNSPFSNDVGKTLDIYHFRNGRFSEWEYVDFAASAPVKEATSMDDTRGWSLKQLAIFPYGDDLSGFPMEALPDTVIDGVNYKRLKNQSMRFDNDPETNEYSFIGYLRCDKKDLSFALSKKFDERWGCMLTRIEYQVKGVSPWFLIEIEFANDRLTADEQAVFDRWETNAKNDPVFYSPEMKGYFTPPGPIPLRDSFSFCGVSYKIPRDCKGKSEVNCCSAHTSPDQLGCNNGTHLSWDYLPTEESARLNAESFTEQWERQMKSFKSEAITCFLAGKAVKATRIAYETRSGVKSYLILAYGTVNNQSVLVQLSSVKKLKRNSDIQPVFKQVIQLEK